MREDARAFSRALERSFFSLHPSFEYCEFIEERRGMEAGAKNIAVAPPHRVRRGQIGILSQRCSCEIRLQLDRLRHAMSPYCRGRDMVVKLPIQIILLTFSVDGIDYGCVAK